MSNAEIEYEPFLTGYDVVFHGIFTLIDPGMNTSEIKPLHLAVPRNAQGLRRVPPTQPNVNTVSPEKEDKRATQRLLNQRYLKPRNLPTSPLPQSPEPAETPKPEPEPAKPAPTPSTPPHTLPRHRPGLSESDNRAVTDTLMKNENFWLFPLAASVQVRFILSIGTGPGKERTFALRVESTGQSVLTASMCGTSCQDGIVIQHDGAVVGHGRYNASNSCFFCGVETPKGKCECCAAVFNPSFTSENQPRIFDFLIPALKKFDGRNNMFPIPFADVSGLVTRLTNMSKEAIRLKTRIPVNSGNSGWDMTFDGKLEQPTTSNFILYHDSSVKKDLCLCGKRKENEYSLEIGYPLSPLQGFLAGVAATMPM